MTQEHATIRRWLRLWFTFEDRVTRRDYFMSGVVLAATKYAGDVLMVRLGTGQIWSPFNYIRPLRTLLGGSANTAPSVLIAALALWALPFLWIGISMSIRRALDAGLSAWLGLLFFVPVVNYAFMLAMSVLPTTQAPPRVVEPPRSYEPRLPRALLAMAAGAAVGLAMLASSVLALRSYGAALFLGTPFVIGALTAFLFNRHYPAPLRETLGVVFMTLGITGGIILATAQEGAICIAMAAPLALGIGVLGAIMGQAVARRDQGPAANALVAVLLLPLSAVVEPRGAEPLLIPVRSAVVVDAPAAVVWQNVIAFSELPAPTELVFRLGIAYPKHAVIRGAGVGAVRYCVFSTGAFVEPITAWEPGRRLAFDVVAQPRPMHEWSPYADLAPPHLDGYFRARRGEFRLISQPDGRTRLEGTTWYEMRIHPEGYWDLIADALVHRIHMRVLTHIKRLSEQTSRFRMVPSRSSRRRR